jgi:hypothetical protein
VSDENPLESFTTSDATPVVLNPRPKKSGGVKKKKAAKKARRVPWHLALFAELCPTLTATIKNALAESGGVRSLADLHRTFEKKHNCTIDRDTFDNAVFVDDTLTALFNKPNLITLPPVSANLNPQKQTPNTGFGPGARASMMVLDDTDDLAQLGITDRTEHRDEILEVMDRMSTNMTVVGDPPSVSPLVGGAPSGWVPPPDPFAPAMEENGVPRTFI